MDAVTFTDVAIWSDWPSVDTLIGGAVVIGAGLAVIAREQRATAG